LIGFLFYLSLAHFLSSQTESLARCGHLWFSTTISHARPFFFPHSSPAGRAFNAIYHYYVQTSGPQAGGVSLCVWVCVDISIET
jgi:hypothetical protein